MSETSHEDEHNVAARPKRKTPDEHSGNQDEQAMLHRRREAEQKLQERQEEASREGSSGSD
ncbi:hypothetical protein SAMN04488693_12012 [Arthrobacter subterraneus]|uniref:Uncharacterized protein n=1 Tax=Arthrobacter subterraneus TaxID=335973 RepID=A0A1G8MVA2_9MICC|nr:hypothetical protein [Arthrobacter subterraneus]SDI71803.1 hypothetical protein SAMN04488693_12012 [Arthrobacter subterraneus]